MKPNVLTSILLVPLGAVFAGAETINIQLDPNPPAAKSGKSGEGNKVADSEKPPPDRGALFETKDQNHDDKLSREEFLTGRADQEAARTRFEKWDTDKDGFLTREEFVNMGGKSK